MHRLVFSWYFVAKQILSFYLRSKMCFSPFLCFVIGSFQAEYVFDLFTVALHILLGILGMSKLFFYAMFLGLDNRIPL